MDQNTFNVFINNFQKFVKDIFSPDCEEKFKVKLMEVLDQSMKLGKSLNIKRLPMVEHMESSPGKKIKLGKFNILFKTLILDISLIVNISIIHLL